MVNIRYYDPSAMKSAAEQISRLLQSYQTAKDNVNAIVTQLNLLWNDEVNLRYSSNYIRLAQPKAEELDKLIQQYNALLYQCATRYGSAIDSGNSYLTGF